MLKVVNFLFLFLHQDKDLMGIVPIGDTYSEELPNLP